MYNNFKYLVMGLVTVEIRLTKCLLYLKLSDEVYYSSSSTFLHISNIPKEKESRFGQPVLRGTVAISTKLLVIGEEMR